MVSIKDNSTDYYVVGVDLGGTKIASALFDASGRLVERTEVETAGVQSARDVLDRIMGTVDAVRGGRKLAGIGLASPGAVNSADGVILQGTNLPEWRDVPLKRWMEEASGTEVQLINDANAAAWGEYVRGAGKGSDSMVYVTFSTGIGAGIVIGGKLLEGVSYFAGELGHVIVDPAGPPCSCGRSGCWEAFASGTSIRNAALEMMKHTASGINDMAAAAGEAVSAKHVFLAKEAGDPVAVQVVDRAIRYMALGLANIIHTFNPDTIVIGGGVSKAAGLIPALQAETEKMVLDAYRGTCRIVKSELGGDVGLVGAAALFQQKPAEAEAIV